MALLIFLIVLMPALKRRESPTAALWSAVFKPPAAIWLSLLEKKGIVRVVERSLNCSAEVYPFLKGKQYGSAAYQQKA